MAANDYYHGSQQPPYDNPPSTSPYYNPHNNISPQSTPAPPYQSGYSTPSVTNPPAAGTSHGAQTNQPAHGTEQSPFDTVFDDHVYPVNSNQRPNPGASSSDMSQQGYYGQDTGYYSQYGQGQPHHGQDIPLQDRPPKDVEMNDHIYDAPGGSHGSKKKNKQGKVRLGELGMFGSGKKRIPWIVYLFSLIQVGVFIGEIVRNSKFIVL